MARYTYARPYARVAEDLTLLVVLVGLGSIALARWPDGVVGIGPILSLGIAVVLVWGVVTLHVPNVVEIDDEGVTFARYGRAHRFAWRDVREVQVRRFVVRDRVLVRVLPAPPWRGRYWIVDAMEGVGGLEGLVRALEGARARASRGDDKKSAGHVA